MAGSRRFAADALTDFAQTVLCKVGLAEAAALDVAEVLVEADLLGHDTHGLHLLPAYVAALESGGMTATGAHEVSSERPAVAVWDGRRLPGPHLVRRALAWGEDRARIHGTAAVAIKRSHHIACLAAYLEAPARAGFVVQLLCSDPAVASVAPFGGTQAVFTPNPIAIAFPTSTDPVIVDISASSTTNGLSARLHKAGRRGEHAYWLDALGQPTDDPGVLAAQPPGTILPLGGIACGHKGYGLALQVEALTGGLAGHGRADISEGWGASVFVQLFDPEAFAGLGAFCWQTDWLVQACRASKPRMPNTPVRLPGERGLARKRDQLEHGVALHEEIPPALTALAGRLGLAAP